MKATYVLAVLALVAASCGEDKKPTTERPADLAKAFRGEWVEGTLNEGKTDPTITDCVAVGRHGERTELSIKSKITLIVTYQYIDSPDCSNRLMQLVEVVGTTFRQVSKNDERQDLQPMHYTYSYGLREGEVPQLLNTERVCGKDSWRSGEYKDSDDQLKSCQPSNLMGLILKSPEMAKPFKESVYRIEKQGDGLKFSRKKPNSSTFDFVQYFVKSGG